MTAEIVKLRHQAFRTLLGALAMPGRVQRLPSGADAALLLDAVYGTPHDGATVVDSELTASLIESAERGTPLSPESGATLVLLVDGASPRTRSRLRGPGVRDTIETTLPLSIEAIAARERACADAPLGVDIIAIEGDTVSALPRTTRIEAIG
jgi:alpha-D-ribose 1-methylphosphonate 5-triphosphate synthase subunit PhnH